MAAIEWASRYQWRRARAFVLCAVQWSAPALMLTDAAHGADLPGEGVAPASGQGWLDGAPLRDWLDRESTRAWQAEALQPDVRQLPAPGTGRESRAGQVSTAGEAVAEPSVPRVRAIYGNGRFRAAELDIAGERHILSTDSSGRLRPQSVAGFRLISFHGNCVGLRRAGVRTDVCWHAEAREDR